MQLEEDVVNHPSHYNQGGVECIDAIESALGDDVTAYYRGNIIKYLWRANHKGGTQDIRKAQWYMDRMVAYLIIKEETQ